MTETATPLLPLVLSLALAGGAALAAELTECGQAVPADGGCVPVFALVAGLRLDGLEAGLGDGVAQGEDGEIDGAAGAHAAANVVEIDLVGLGHVGGDVPYLMEDQRQADPEFVRTPEGRHGDGEDDRRDH